MSDLSQGTGHFSFLQGILAAGIKIGEAMGYGLAGGLLDAMDFTFMFVGVPWCTIAVPSPSFSNNTSRHDTVFPFGVGGNIVCSTSSIAGYTDCDKTATGFEGESKRQDC